MLWTGRELAPLLYKTEPNWNQKQSEVFIGALATEFLSLLQDTGPDHGIHLCYIHYPSSRVPWKQIDISRSNVYRLRSCHLSLKLCTSRCTQACVPYERTFTANVLMLAWSIICPSFVLHVHLRHTPLRRLSFASTFFLPALMLFLDFDRLKMVIAYAIVLSVVSVLSS
jgi:hypothetical protein